MSKETRNREHRRSGLGGAPNLDRDERDLVGEELAKDLAGKPFRESGAAVTHPSGDIGRAEQKTEEIEQATDPGGGEAYESGDNHRNRGSSITGSTDRGGAMKPEK